MVIDRELYAIEVEEAVAQFEALRSANFRPFSTITPREYAESLLMPAEEGATKLFSFSYAPYQLEPFQEFFNPQNIETDLMMASRLGKSRIVLSALGFKIEHQPCRIGVMWPVEGDGKLWIKDDFMGELVEPNEPLQLLIGDARGQRDAKNTILHKRFRGGLLQVAGGNAPGRLRRMKARWLYGDEIDGLETMRMETKDGRKGKSEGDILEIFAKRGSEYADCTQIYCSYPSLRGRSRIEAKLLETDLRQWVVTCPICGDPFIMHRTGVNPFGDNFKRSKLVYDRDKPQLARLECPHKGCLLDDHDRHRMMMGGDPKKPRYDLWQPTRPYRGRAGFHANSLLMPHKYGDERYLAKLPGGYLQELAEKEIKVETAENPEASKMVLVNTEDSETFQRECDAKPAHTDLFRRREKYDPEVMLPAGVLWIAFGCDVQSARGGRLEVEICGFGENRQTWGLGYHIIKGSPLSPPSEGVWAELDRIVSTSTFPHPSGRTLRVSAGLIDRGHKPDQVLAFTRPRARRGIFASRGGTTLGKPLLPTKPKWEGNPKARVYELGIDQAKDMIYQRLDLAQPLAAGYLHYPELACYSEAYFAGLIAEDSEMEKGNDGNYHRHFTNPKNLRNEPLDIRVMLEAIVRIRRPNFKKLAEDFAKAMPSTAEAAREKEKQMIDKIRAGQRRNFATKGLSKNSPYVRTKVSAQKVTPASDMTAQPRRVR